MSNRPTPPSVTEYSIGEHERLMARFEEQAREIERLRLNIADYNEHERCYQAEIAALKARSSGVMDEREAFQRWIPDHYWLGEMEIARQDEEYAHMEVQVAWEVWQARAELSALKAGQGEAVAWIVTDINGDSYFAYDRQTPSDTPLYTVPPATGDAVSVPKSRFNNYEITLMINDLDHAEYSDITAALREYAELRALLEQSEGVKP